MYQLVEIDHRHNFLIFIDTETCNTISDNGKLDMTNVLCYDVGISVADTKGRIYEKYSLIVKEVFYGMAELMKSAYYASKIPMYEQEIAEGKHQVVAWYEVVKLIKELLKKYATNIVVSHNARFDNGSLKITQRYLTKSKYRFVLPYGIEYYDTLKMARTSICKRKEYIKYCQENGYMTKHKTPRPRATAEILYRFITDNAEFEESHTGLADTLIEVEIFKYCMEHKTKDMKKALYERA